MLVQGVVLIIGKLMTYLRCMRLRFGLSLTSHGNLHPTIILDVALGFHKPLDTRTRTTRADNPSSNCTTTCEMNNDLLHILYHIGRVIILLDLAVQFRD